MSHVLVSGGTRGIGAAISEIYLVNGFNVSCIYNTSDKNASDFYEAMSEYKDHLSIIRADVSSEEETKLAVYSAVKKFGDVDILVSNAGISMTGLANTFSFADYHRLFDVNFGGFFNLTNCIIPSMVSRKSGVIIAISSMWGQVGASCEALYSASKGAIDSYTKALAKELGPSGIRVNAVSPGVIATDMISQYSMEDIKALEEETPIERIGNPQDIANMVYFLSSDNSTFVTGQIIGVNGGFCI